MNPELASACVPALTRHHPLNVLAPHLRCGTCPVEVGELRVEDGSLLPSKWSCPYLHASYLPEPELQWGSLLDSTVPL